MIIKLNYNGNPNIGIFLHANDKFVIAPPDISFKLRNSLEEALKVPIISTTIYATNLIGIFVVTNSNGLLLPSITYLDEENILKENLENLYGMNVELMPSRYTALGNIILANDKGAIVHPELAKEHLKTVSDCLDVEIIKGRFFVSPLVGSVAVATNKGCIVHPLAEEREIEWLGDVLKISCDIGTISRGVTFISSGLVANSHGAIISETTTGPEIQNVSRVLNI